MASIYLQTFGCQMNAADSNGLAHQAWSMGCTFTNDPAQADIIIVNTCAIREKAETRVYGRLGQLKPFKDMRPDTKVLVAGCLAEKDRAIMRTKAPFIDALLGPREYNRFKQLLTEWGVPSDAPPPRDDVHDAVGRGRSGAGRRSAVRALPRARQHHARLREVLHVLHRAVHARPARESRPRRDRKPSAARDPLRRERDHAARPKRQFVLSRSERSRFLASCCLRIGRIEGLERLTFLTSHPKDFGPDVVDALAQLPNVAPRLHLPVQSASNNVLKAMAQTVHDRGVSRKDRLLPREAAALGAHHRSRSSAIRRRPKKIFSARSSSCNAARSSTRSSSRIRRARARRRRP